MGLNPKDTGARLRMIVPGQEMITLFIRNPAPPDDIFTPYTFRARGRPSSQPISSPNDTVLAVTRKTWHLYRSAMNAAGVPQNTTSESFDYLTDQSGSKWLIDSVDAKSNWSFVIVESWKAV
jgi:hypothetical protein